MQKNAILIVTLLCCFWGCKSNVTSSSRDTSEGTTKLYVGAHEYLSLPNTQNSAYVIKEGDYGSLQKSLLLGKLAIPSHLELTSEKITLTQISMQAATNIETGFFQIASKQYGKYALIKGNWDGGEMVYQAEIVCLLSKDLDDELKKSLKSGKISLSDVCQ